MSNTLTVTAPAKLNLFLHITGQRADGYHNLQTLFQLLDWGDTLHFSPNDSSQVTLECPELGFNPTENLILRAAAALDSKGRGMHIKLDKRIPVGGGLGGGSSDAATTLLALNQLWQLGHSNEALQAIGASLGADVPVFVAGHSAWAEGVGDLLTPVDLPAKWYLVIFPETPVNTGEIFSQRQLTRDSAPITIAAFFEGYTRNDCQDVVAGLYPEIANVLKWLEKHSGARLTGTGASVFASFDTQAEAQNVLDQAPAGWSATVVKGVNRSPALAELNLPI
ncbi:MAG: 4-(cytidine 5'-diphospho)-2-C-methyl-D-erythritol kinase [Halieaceae bacterium]